MFSKPPGQTIIINFESTHADQKWTLVAVYGPCQGPLRDEFVQWLFHLIIPEADLLEDTHLCDIMSKTDKMKWIEQLAIDMWRQGGICSIQVGWEGSECGISMEEMINGIKPIAEPFAIVPSALYRAEWGLEKREIEGDGIFIYNKEHWYYLSV